MALTIVRYKRQALAIKTILFDGSIDMAIDLTKTYPGIVWPLFDEEGNFEGYCKVKTKHGISSSLGKGEYLCQEVRSNQFVVLTQSDLDTEFEIVT